jgi:hypothetical protein
MAYYIHVFVYKTAKHIAYPEEKWHNSKLPFFRRSNLIIFLIRVFEIEESETVNTYVGEKGILHT